MGYATAGTALTAGEIEFDERGNSRWIPRMQAFTRESLIEMLDIDWLEIAQDDTREVHRNGFEEIYRAGT